MNIETQHNGQLDKVAELVKEIKFAMLTTEEPDGKLRSRPMTTMQMDEDGNLWFFTSRTAPQAGDIEQQFHVNVSYANADKQDYLSVCGTADVIRDKQKMQELWTPWIKPWFPDGLDDPDLVLLKVAVDEAEYWDAPGSTVKRWYGLAKGIATGKTDAMGKTGTVRVQH